MHSLKHFQRWYGCPLLCVDSGSPFLKVHVLQMEDIWAKTIDAENIEIWSVASPNSIFFHHMDTNQQLNAKAMRWAVVLVLLLLNLTTQWILEVLVTKSRYWRLDMSKNKQNCRIIFFFTERYTLDLGDPKFLAPESSEHENDRVGSTYGSLLHGAK